MTRWETDDLGSVADLEREESRSGARFDNRSLRLIAGAFVDEDDVPQLEPWECE